MTDRIKWWLGLSGVVALLALAWSVASFASSYSASITPSSYRSFQVTGEGKVTGVPDVAQISFGVTTEGSTDVGKLQTDNTAKMNAIVDLLKQNGIADKDIQTTNYSIQPRTQYYNCDAIVYPITVGAGNDKAKPCPPSQTVGYTIDQSVRVKMRDFTKIGAVLSGVARAGANNISSLQFTVDDQSQLEAQARAKAVIQARAKADAMAQAGSFSIGRLLSIDEEYAPQPYRYSAVPMMASTGASSAPGPIIEAGSQEVTVSLTLRYEIR